MGYRRMMDRLYNSLIRSGYRWGYRTLRVWWFLRRPHTHGAAVALWHEGRVLLLRTSYRDCYSLPGGFAKPGEPPEQAAARELQEELGIRLPAAGVRHAWNGSLRFESRTDTVNIWEVALESRPDFRVKGREIVWAGWLTPAEARQERLLPHLAAYLALK